MRTVNMLGMAFGVAITNGTKLIQLLCKHTGRWTVRLRRKVDDKPFRPRSQTTHRLQQHRTGVGAFTEQPELVNQKPDRLFAGDCLGICRNDLEEGVRVSMLDDAAIDAKFNVHNAQLAELAKEAGSKFEVTGTAAADVHLFGTVAKPIADLTAQVEKLAAFDEQIDRVNAKIHYADDALTISGGDATVGPGRIHFDGSYDKAETITFDVTAENLPDIGRERNSRIALILTLKIVNFGALFEHSLAKFHQFGVKIPP